EKDLKAKLDNSKTSSKDLKTAMDALETAKKNVKTATTGLTDAEKSLSDAQKKAKEDADKFQKSMEDVNKELFKIHVDVAPKVSQDLIDLAGNTAALKTMLDNVPHAALDVQNALVSMGVTPKEDLKLLAETAETNFNLIKDSGLASA